MPDADLKVVVEKLDNVGLILKDHGETLRAGCPTSLGFKIDCMENNVADFSQTLGLIIANPDMTEVLVRDYNNVNHTITVDQYKQMCLELGAHVMSVRQAYWADIDAL